MAEQKITIKPKESFKIPVDGYLIGPDNMAGKSADDIKAMETWHGNQVVSLGSLFDITVDGSAGPEDTTITLEGDFSRVKRIGSGMGNGKIIVNGGVDMHCGAVMSGGTIVVNGNADSWAGREMNGGELIIEGNAGDYVGSAYRGETVGMKGGKITVKGNVGDYVGDHMGGGEIEVGGDAGLLAGLNMTGGSITIEGNADLPGAEMTNGTVIVKGAAVEMLPSFKFEGSESIGSTEFKKYTGDLAVRGSGKGTLYVK
ncbi:MAG: formylmethanofuran dehydrogenase subunit C [Halobacteriota archaeon]|nr:formylmethanofuran dehydrogenase subunit C [Halobacteriota archaeon]